MQGEQPISWLMFFTLAAGIAVAAIGFVSFLRSSHNRRIAAVALEGDGRGQGIAPSGALPELIGVFIAAVLAMGLLTLGYQHQGRGTGVSNAAATPPMVPPSNTSKGTTVGAGAAITPPEAPTRVQPSRPEPDLRTAPTGSSTGTDGVFPQNSDGNKPQ